MMQEQVAVQTQGATALPYQGGFWGFLESIKLKLGISNLLSSINLSNTLEFAMCAIAGFFVGILFKRYFNTLLIIIAAIIVLLIGLEYLKFVMVNWSTIYTFIGLPANTTIGSLFSMLLNYIRTHIFLFFSVLIGFIIGYKLG